MAAKCELQCWLQVKLSSSCQDLLRRLMGSQKMTASEIMKQPWFLVDFPKGLRDMNAFCLKMKVRCTFAAGVPGRLAWCKGRTFTGHRGLLLSAPHSSPEPVSLLECGADTLFWPAAVAREMQKVQRLRRVLSQARCAVPEAGFPAPAASTPAA